MIRVGIVARAAALRLGLRELLLGLPEIEVAAEAAQALDLPPVDVLILTMPASLADLPPEPPPVLLLTDDAERAAGLANLRVWGLLPLEASVEELSAALHALVEGLVVGSPVLVGRLVERPMQHAFEGAEEIIDPLTARERQVLQLAAEGLANKEIAARLQLSEHTVKFHLSSLYSKLGVSSRTEAVRTGTRQGWVIL
ncbi:MAG TPA: response regulator transcription factor [Bellilinea sp.]|nr:response regulator transcription factor [Bellilinea sp.]